jgi:hypothetical protein
MPLTLNQFLFLVLTFAAVIIAVFLVRFLIQLRRTALEGEKTMVEVRKLVQNLDDLDKIVKTRLTDLGEIMEASKKTAAQVSQATFFLTTRVIRPTSRYWPVLFPLVRFLWKKFRKRKEKKDGG